MKRPEESPHDSLFKSILKKPDNARDFLETALPTNVVSRLDLRSVRVEDVSYIDENLKKHFSDIVLSVGLKDGAGEANVYVLLEHKSGVDNLVALQVLRYMALKWHELEKNGELTGGKLPPIIPVVFYQGPRKWKSFASFRPLIDFPSADFEKYAPDFDFEFFDVPGLSDGKLREMRDKVVLHFYLAMLKSLHSPELKRILPALVEGLAKTLESETAMDYVRVFFRYMAQTTPNMDRETMRGALNAFPEGGEKIMDTLAEQWKNEGISIGEKIGFEKGEKIGVKKGEKIGVKKGEKIGVKKGELKHARNIFFVVAQGKFDILPQQLVERINRIESTEILDELIRKTLACESLERLEGWVDKALGDR